MYSSISDAGVGAPLFQRVEHAEAKGVIHNPRLRDCTSIRVYPVLFFIWMWVTWLMAACSRSAGPGTELRGDNIDRVRGPGRSRNPLIRDLPWSPSSPIRMFMSSSKSVFTELAGDFMPSTFPDGSVKLSHYAASQGPKKSFRKLWGCHPVCLDVCTQIPQISG
jgi:hypothetical protein